MKIKPIKTWLGGKLSKFLLFYKNSIKTTTDGTQFEAKKGNSPRLKYQPDLWTAIEAGGWEVGEVKNSKSPPNTSALYLPVSPQNTHITFYQKPHDT